MSGGRRPDLVLKAKPKGGSAYVTLGAAWKSDKGMGWNFKLEPGCTLVTVDGEDITGESHWFSIFENKGAAPSAPKASTKPSFDDFGGTASRTLPAFDGDAAAARVARDNAEAAITRARHGNAPSGQDDIPF